MSFNCQWTGPRPSLQANLRYRRSRVTTCCYWSQLVSPQSYARNYASIKVHRQIMVPTTKASKHGLTSLGAFSSKGVSINERLITSWTLVFIQTSFNDHWNVHGRTNNWSHVYRLSFHSRARDAVAPKAPVTQLMHDLRHKFRIFDF